MRMVSISAGLEKDCPSALSPARCRGRALITGSVPQRCRCALSPVKTLTHLLPADIVEEGIDIFRRCGTEVHLIGVLVHVHHEQWIPRCDGLRVVASPVGA